MTNREALETAKKLELLTFMPQLDKNCEGLKNSLSIFKQVKKVAKIKEAIAEFQELAQGSEQKFNEQINSLFNEPFEGEFDSFSIGFFPKESIEKTTKMPNGAEITFKEIIFALYAKGIITE